jgi:predicted secreted protein
MSAVTIPGRLAKIELSNDGGSTFTTFGGLVDVTMNLTIDELETTSHDSAGSREYIPNHHDISLDLSARWIDGDPGQELAINSAFDKTTLNFRFRMETLSNKKQFTGTCFPTSYSPAGPLDDAGSIDITLRCSGVSMTAQT